MNNINKYAELKSAKKASKEGIKLSFSGHIMSAKFNPITFSLNNFFVKRVVIQQIRVN